MSVTIEGHSDDLVCVRGQVAEEFYAVDQGVIVSASTGHQLLARYSDLGIWRITHHAGPEEGLSITVYEGDGEDGYSDIAVIDANVNWVRARPADSDDPGELTDAQLADLLDEIVSDFGPYRQELGDLAAAHEASNRLRRVRPLRVEVYETRRALESEPDEFVHVVIEHRWRVRHTSNGEIMAQGEGYSDRRDRDHAVHVLFPDVDVIEVEQ